MSRTPLGRQTLFVNPPLIDGIAFTRQGRCQEREEVLGTTKPPYSLALLAALFRARGHDVRLVDQTAERLATQDLIARLRAEGFHPTLIVFCSTTPTLDADAREMAALKAAFDAPLVCFGPHASTAPRESMERAPMVDAMAVGEPEETLLELAAALAFADAHKIRALTVRRNGDVIPHEAKGSWSGFAETPEPAWDLLDLERYRVPLLDEPYVMVETSRGCPYSCDFCVAPIHQGHRFRERSAVALVDEIERVRRKHGIRYFYLWGDTVTLNAASFGRFCDELIARKLDVGWFGNARADNLVDPAFVARLRRSGCWMLALGVESESDDLRRDMLKKLEREKIVSALRNMRAAGIKSFAFFIYGYPGDTRRSMERTTRFALDLDPDFANFYPAVPYPGTELHEKARREGLLASEDWSKMEYSYYLLRGGELDERSVMGAIQRARRRFFLRPRYVMRHGAELMRLALAQPLSVLGAFRRMFVGRSASPAPLAARPLLPIGELTPGDVAQVQTER